MRLSEFSRITGFKRTTLQMYDKKGILKPIKNEENGYWEYEESSLGDALMVIVLKEAGLSLKEIKTALRNNLDYEELMDSAANKIRERIAYLEGSLRYIDLIRNSAENWQLIEPVLSKLGIVNLMLKESSLYEERKQFIQNNNITVKEIDMEDDRGESEEDEELSSQEVNGMIQILRAVFYIPFLINTEPPEGPTVQETLLRVYQFAKELTTEEQEALNSRKEFSDELTDIVQSFEEEFGKERIAYMTRALESFGESEKD